MYVCMYMHYVSTVIGLLYCAVLVQGRGLIPKYWVLLMCVKELTGPECLISHF